ncbi:MULTISPECIES: nucleotidyltransferase domain-containing protein [Cyanophyceae]
MWVFGSVARGESHQTNDVDFLWRCRQGTAC